MRRIIRIGGFGFLVGTLLVGGALAGVVVDPFDTAGISDPTADVPGAGTPLDAPESGSPTASTSGSSISPADLAAVASSAPDPTLTAGVLHAGAAAASLDPSGNVYGTWERADCTAIDDANLEVDHVVPSLADLRGWPAASPDCIYLGGFGIGPARVAKSLGHGGVWVRAVAFSNGTDVLVYAVADTVGWFARYDSAICSDCGVRDVRESLASDLGIPVGNVIIGSTHTHAGADTYGGWGGIPDWYRAQIRDAATAAVKQAVANLEPATLLAGEVSLGDRNNERRDTYYSTADTGATWVRATAADDSTIATLATYAGHPTIVSGPVLHADWPGATARRFEADGGVGVVFEGGLGNVSVRGASGVVNCAGLGISGKECEAENTGAAIADAIRADIAEPDVDDVSVSGTTFGAQAQDITHPVTTNPGLTTLASAGLFDREFTPGTPGAGPPGAYHWSRKGEVSTSGGDNDPEFAGVLLNGCSSSGPTVITTAGAHRIGNLLIGFAPGEIFSNIAEVVKERADGADVTMVLGQTNDALGYIIQSFEYDTAAGAATHYGTQTNEYEEVFAIDRCFGDHVLETILESSGALGFGR